MLLLGQKPLCCFDVELIIGFSTFSTQDQLELSKRETSGLYESKRQLQLKLKTLQSCLKTEKDEVKLRDKYKGAKFQQYCGVFYYSIHMTVYFLHSAQVQKLQSVIASRASQYTHDAKRKERECIKLKERLNQLLIDRKDKKLGKYVSFILAKCIISGFVLCSGIHFGLLTVPNSH